MNEFFQSFSYMTPISFALTYLLHSTVWVIVIALLIKLPFLNTPQWRNYLWKAALVGGICSSIFVSRQQCERNWVIAVQEKVQVKTCVAIPIVDDCAIIADDYKAPTPISAILPIEASTTTATEMASLEPITSKCEEVTQTTTSWMLWGFKWITISWLLFGGILLVRLYRQHKKYFQSIAPRREINTNNSPKAILNKLKETTRLTHKQIRLSQSDHLDSPILIQNHEICLPTKAVSELDEKQLEAMLAHELAHIARRDYQWNCLMCLLQTIFFFQPLLTKVIKEIKQSNELLCDAWAANATGNQIAVAQCLVTVAAWIREKPKQYELVAGMALQKSELSSRVESLLNHPCSEKRTCIGRTSFLVLSLLGIIMWVLPGFSLKNACSATPYVVELNQLDEKYEENVTKTISPFLESLQEENLEKVNTSSQPTNPPCDKKVVTNTPVYNNAYTQEGTINMITKEKKKKEASLDVSEVKLLSTKKQCGVLLQAIKNNDIAYVQQLLAFVSPNCMYCGGESSSTPLNVAARVGTVQMGKILIDAGAHVYHKARQDEGALLGAVQNRQFGFVQLLLDHGVYINTDITGHGTPLVNAIKRGDYKMTQFLLERGADPSLKTEAGENPSELANRKGKQLLELLNQYMRTGNKLLRENHIKTFQKPVNAIT